MIENKVLVVGQAPPIATQTVPYDTTMLYKWFKEAGLDITEDNVHDYCNFHSVYDKFPGVDSNGGHRAPTKVQMNDAYDRYLKEEIDNHKYLLVLGSVPKNFLQGKLENKIVLYLIHPSYRCYNQYIKDKDIILKSLRILFNQLNK